MAQRIRLEVVFDTTDHNPDNVIERIRKELRLLLGDSLVEVEQWWEE